MISPIQLFTLGLFSTFYAMAENAPLRLKTIDGKSEKTVPKAQLEIKWFDKNGEKNSLTTVTNQEGKATVNLPLSTSLSITPRAKDYLNEHIYGGVTTYSFISKNKDEILTVLMNKGVTIKGRVIDKESGQAIPGATVAPYHFTPPVFTPDRSRAITSEQEGHFTLPLVDPSLGVSASAYGYFGNEQSYKELPTPNKDNQIIQELALKKAPLVSGTILSSAENPLASVKVNIGEHSTVTNELGQFDLPLSGSEHATQFFLDIEHEGYLDYYEPHLIEKHKNLEITLKELPHVRGKAINSEGNPITNFHLIVTPGVYSRSYNSVEKDFNQEKGSFALPLARDSDFTLTAQASGHPLFHKHYPAEQQNKPLLIQFQSPTQIHLPFQLPHNFNDKLQVELHRLTGRSSNLIIGDNDGSSLLETVPHEIKNEVLTLQNLAPQQDYLLILHHPSLTPTQIPFTTKTQAITLQSVTIQKRGALTGQVFQSHDEHSPWALAKGEVTISGLPYSLQKQKWVRPISFQADENGKFSLSGVPAGEVTVSFNYWVSADILDSLSAKIVVSPEKVAHVVIGAPRKIRNHAVKPSPVP